MNNSIIIVNFKSYAEASGENALNLAKICDKVAKELNADIRVAVDAADIRMISREVSIPVYAQHVDEVEPGAHTGYILPEEVKEAGATGTILNHSEHRLRMDVLEKSIERAKQCELITVVCANDASIGKAVNAFNPDFVAVEPPELIGGDISVSSAQPELIKESAVKVAEGGSGKLLVGAGVHNGQDVRTSLELGAVGVLLASGVAKSKDPEKVLRDLLS